jgi:hypothetical protein
MGKWVFLEEMLTLDTATATHTATHSIWYRSNRLILLFPTVPITATHHCHSYCHCHTFAAFPIFCHFSSFFFTFFATSISPSILPLPLPFYHHSNRPDPLFPTLPPNHCHSPYLPCHCHTFAAFTIFCHFSSFFLPNLRPSYLGQYCHCHTLPHTIRTASLSSFQRYHPTTATPPTATSRSRSPASPSAPPPRTGGRSSCATCCGSPPCPLCPHSCCFWGNCLLWLWLCWRATRCSRQRTRLSGRFCYSLWRFSSRKWLFWSKFDALGSKFEVFAVVLV